MKKGMILIGLGFWFCICMVRIDGRTTALTYEIHYDSHAKETYTVKEQMEQTYQKLTRGVSKDSQHVMMLYNIERFSNKDVKAKWNGKLILIQGDGKGVVVDGKLDHDAYCIEKVQPKSLLWSLFHDE